jgi:hypothetical protein
MPPAKRSTSIFISLRDEFDSNRVEGRLGDRSREVKHLILQAYRAIQERTRKLWYEGAQQTRQRTRLDAASHSSAMLRELERRGAA